jgi:tetratricopeptide (TPR) repeat protein
MRTLLAMVAICLSTAASAQIECRDLRSGYGPFDYRTATDDVKAIVELHHFTPEVESLRRGNTGAVGGDIDYTLRVFPNHVRALRAMDLLTRKENSDKPKGARAPIHCYFERALQFTPDDMVVRLIYGLHFLGRKSYDDAIDQFKAAEAGGLQDPNVPYNLGLAYLETKQYDKALEYAHKAYAMGFPLPGLRNRLSALGKWKALPPE